MIQNTLQELLRTVFGDYTQWPTEWSRVFKTEKSDKAFEIDQEMRFLGPAQFKDEGGPIATDIMGQRIQTTYNMRQLALQYTITEEAQEDNLYKKEFPKGSESLKRSLMIAKEILAANIFNNGFDTNFPGGDGRPLYSLDHPIDTGTYANRPVVGQDLNEATLEAGFITIEGFVDQAGINCQVLPEMLMIPRQLKFTADRLTESEFRPGTANNDINSTKRLGMLPKGYMVNHWLTSSTAWFINTNAQEGFKHFQRTKVKTNVITEPSTFSLICSARERYALGYSNARCSYANPGT